MKELVIIAWKRKDKISMDGKEKLRLPLEEWDKISISIE